ncbi:unnamed protein product [Ilex paraguariensis]|uniref:Pentatricopeptide repeat-containing protein n=1 Tax=Ilex paraguariensis TaxID=185542 RepID=A0ABC8SAU3_9AQUA
MGVNAASLLSHLLRSTHKSTSLPTDAKTLTKTILSHLNTGRLGKAVSILFAFPESFDFSLYAHLFKICASNRAIVEVRKLESHLFTFNPYPPVFLLNRAIEAYGKCGCLDDARELFDEMPHKDGGSWNSLIIAYSQNGFPEKALNLFLNMNNGGIIANEITFASVLGSCGDVLALCFSRQIHGLVLKYGFCGNVILGSSLVDIYGKCRIMSDARRMFDEIENPNAVSWNVIVRRYFDMGDGKTAVFMFFEMIKTNLRPLSFTVSNALIACTSIYALKEGVQIHGVAIKINVEEDEIVSSSLIDLYAKCGELVSAHIIFDLPSSKNLINWTSMVSAYAMSGRTREARELFNEMPERNVITWNAMLTGYKHSCQWEEALDFVFLMRKVTRDVDHVTLGLILNLSAALLDVELGKQVHGFAYRHGFHSNLLVGNALLDMYGKCGTLRSARYLFYDLIGSRDKVSWNSLLTSYAHHQMSEEAILLVWKILGETTPSKYTFGTLLAACANIFALEAGKQIHGFMIRNGYEIDIVVRGALLDMYSKCRCLEYALKVFKEATARDLILWNSILLGCCHNKKGEKVLELFELMEKEGVVKPDHITFKGILLACICEGRVELARHYFNLMSQQYCIIPRLEHYESMIELYSRYGFMDELKDFVKKMPFELTAPMLTRVFDACREHRCSRLGKWAADRLNELNPTVPFRFEIMDKT